MYDERGSVWRKWDLHVHTPESYEENFGDDWDEYVRQVKEKAIKHEISVMGVTDYFSVDGYEKLVNDYSPQGKSCLELENGELLHLLPNVELRLDNFGDQNQSINLHVVFSEKLNPSTIRDNFLEELQVNYRDNILSCKESNLVKIGYSESEGIAFNADLDIDNINSPERNAYYRTALGLITLSFRNIKDELFDFKKSISEWGINQESYVFVIAAKGHGGLDSLEWTDEFIRGDDLGRAGNIRQGLLYHTNICFSNRKNDKEFCLGKNEGCLKEEFKNRFRSFKPCIWGSDAHDLENLFHPSNGATEDYTWIKGDPTFEGLRQIIFEPKSRIEIGENPPPPPPKSIDKLSYNIQEGLSVEKQEDGDREKFCLKGKQEIYFSPNLNCLIGGRGTGKSTILNLMRLKVEEEGVNLYPDSEVTDEDGNSILFDDLIEIDGTTSREVEFLSQNEIEQFALNTLEFTKAIYDRLKQVGDRDNLSQKSTELSNLLTEIDDAIDHQNTKLNRIKKLQKKEKAYRDKRKEIKILEDEKYSDLQEEINKYSKQLTKLKGSRNKLIKMLSDISDIIQEYEPDSEQDEEKNELEQLIDEGLELLRDFYENNLEKVREKGDREKELEEELSKAETNLKVYLAELGYEDQNITNISSAQSQANQLDLEIERVEKEIKTLGEKVSLISFDDNLRMEFEDLLTPRIDQLNKTLKRISENTEEVKEISLEYDFDQKRAFKNFCELFNSNELPSFDSGNSLSKKDIIDLFRYFYKNDGIWELKEDEKILEILEEKRNKKKTNRIVFEYFSKNTEEKLKLLKLYSLLHKINVEKYLKINVTYDGRNIESSSFGQRCTAAIVILLSLGSNPIIIDEPEAHLDSGLIAKYLVQLIKDRKRHRQIIFATHNANFVINGDSELIHVLDMDKQNKTEITPTTIENKEHRPALYNLEGGEEAFKQREKKYNFQ